MDRFDQWKTGKLEIEMVGETPLALLFTLDEKKQIFSLLDTKETTVDEGFDKMNKLLLGILKASYPDTEPKALEAYVVEKADKILEGISIKVGWTTREKIDAIEKQILAKANDEEGTPGKKEQKKTSDENSSSNQSEATKPSQTTQYVGVMR